MSGVWILVAFGGVCLAFFAVYQFAVSVGSGWREMARRFPDRSRLPRTAAGTRIRIGRYFQFQYSDAVIGLDESGLHLRLHVGELFWHPPLLFPWSTVDARPAITFVFRPWDVYGVGYYTAIAIPQRSRAAKLLRDYSKAYAEADHR